MHSPLVEPVLNGKEVGLEFLGDWLVIKCPCTATCYFYIV
jgi:hypothetical protein